MTDTDFTTVAADQPDGVTVRVRRGFAAPREVVWRAMTDDTIVKRWLLGPPGWSMPVCDMDVRVGGAFRWSWRDDKTGGGFGFHGEYLEVEAPGRLVCTEVYDPAAGEADTMGSCVVTTELAEDGQRTLMTMLIRYPDTATRDTVVGTGMVEGMEMSYGRLDGLLPEVQAAPSPDAS